MKPASEMSAEEHRAEAARLIDEAHKYLNPEEWSIGDTTDNATLALAHLAYAQSIPLVIGPPVVQIGGKAPRKRSNTPSDG